MTQAKSLGALNTTQVLINFTGKTSASELTDLIVARLGLSSVYAAKDYVFTQIINAGGVSKAGGAILDTLNLFTTLTNDSTFGSYANAYVSKLNAALAYSLVTTNNSTDLTTLARVVSSSNSSSNIVTSSDASNNSDTVTFTMRPTATSMNEGTHNLIVVSSTNAVPGSTLSYTIAGIDASRLASGSLTGVLTLDSYGQAVIDLGIVANLYTDGSTTATVSLVNGKASTRIAITDSSRTPETISPSYTLGTSSSSLDEGSRNLITLTTANIATGSQFSYLITGIDPARLSTGSLAGTFTTDANGRAILDLGVLNNNHTDGSTTVRLSLANGLAATSFTVNDTSLSSDNSNSNSNTSSGTLALTTDSETIDADNSDIITGTLSGTGTYSDGDVILGESGTILRLTASGANSAIAEVDGVGQVQLILNANSSLDTGLWSNVDQVLLTGGSSQKLFTLFNAALETLYGIASSKQQTLVLEYAETGSDNTALLKLAGSGLAPTNSTEHRATIDISSNGSVHHIDLTTSDTNYAELIAHTDVNNITISGTGNNNIKITDADTQRFSLVMSESTAANTIDIGNGLNDRSELIGGSGNDTLIATIENNSYADLEMAPTIVDIEALHISTNFLSNNNVLNLDARFTENLQTISLGTPVDVYIVNLSTDFETLNITQTNSQGNSDFGITYDDNQNALGDLTINIGDAEENEILIDELNVAYVDTLTINTILDTDVDIWDLYIENDSIRQLSINNHGTGVLSLDRPNFTDFEPGIDLSLELITLSSTAGGILEAGNFWTGDREEGGTFLPRGDYFTPDLDTIRLHTDNSSSLYVGDIAAYYIDESEYEYSSLRTIDLFAGQDSILYMGRVYAGGTDYYADDGNHWGVENNQTRIDLEAEEEALIDWGNSSWNEDAYIGGYLNEISVLAKSHSNIYVGDIQVIGRPPINDQTSNGAIGSISIEAQDQSTIALNYISTENDMGDIDIRVNQGAEIDGSWEAGSSNHSSIESTYGSIGDITFTAENNADYSDLNFYAYDHSSWVDYSDNVEIGDFSLFVGSNTSDQDFYFESDGSIGDMTIDVSDGSATYITVNARKSVGQVILSGEGEIHLMISDDSYEFDYNSWSWIPWTALTTADEIDASATTGGVDIYTYVINGSRVITGLGNDDIQFGDNDATDTIVYQETNVVGSTTGSLIDGTRDSIEGFESGYDAIQFGNGNTSFLESLIAVDGGLAYANAGTHDLNLEMMNSSSQFTHGVLGAIEYYDDGSNLKIAINTNHNNLLDDGDIVITLVGMTSSVGASWGFTLSDTGSLFIT